MSRGILSQASFVAPPETPLGKALVALGLARVYCCFGSSLTRLQRLHLSCQWTPFMTIPTNVLRAPLRSQQSALSGAP